MLKFIGKKSYKFLLMGVIIAFARQKQRFTKRGKFYFFMERFYL